MTFTYKLQARTCLASFLKEGGRLIQNILKSKKSRVLIRGGVGCFLTLISLVIVSFSLQFSHGPPKKGGSLFIIHFFICKFKKRSSLREKVGGEGLMLRRGARVRFLGNSTHLYMYLVYKFGILSSMRLLQRTSYQLPDRHTKT